ncbi:hypothetical protein ACQPWW_12155 [Micromonospora sp. CA-240977]|uniref:DUF7919 family protein n=1 Tax=Micromonospora sp. CA-240977 TaxID=3239957 RepID=UPI003D915406
MTHFADLTPYRYLERHDEDEPRPDLPLLNVGWLHASHPFPTGAPTDGLMPALRELATTRVRQTRGHHYCEICVRDSGELLHYIAAHEYLPPAEFCAAALAATS